MADDWRKDRDHIDMRLIKNRRWAAYFGLLGSMTAIGQHELVVQGYEARSALMNILKAAGDILVLELNQSSVRTHWACICLEIRLTPCIN